MEKLKQIPLTVPVPLTLAEVLKIDTGLAAINALRIGGDPEAKVLMEKLEKIRSENRWWKIVFPPEVEEVLAKIEKNKRRV